VIGETLSGRYRIERLLGRGGMSAVWLAWDGELEREVAVKILHSRRLESADAVERFEREARTLASLAHPGIVTVIDRGEEDGRPFIVFEYVRGPDLRTRIAERGGLEPAEAYAVCSQVADALAYAHDQGVIHRDVKPHNVLLAEDGTAKLTDFGIARVIEAPSLTSTGRVLGTGEYLAPEQAAGEGLDERADVYALGVMLFHCLTGETPYQGEGFVDLAAQHMRAPIPSVRTRRPDLPEDVDAVVGRALAKRVDDRYPNCTEMRHALDDLLAATPAGAAEAPGDVPAVVPARRPEATTPYEGLGAPIPLPPAVQAPRRSRTSTIRGLALLAAVLVTAGVCVAIVAIALAGNDTSPARSATPPTTSSSSSSAPRPPSGSAVIPATAIATFDPEGDGVENPQSMANATDANPATVWTTEHYSAFVKHGVGLVLDAGAGVRADSVRLVTPVPGWSAQILYSRAASPPTTSAGWSPDSAVTVVDQATKTIPLTGRQDARFYLVWITSLVQNGDPNAPDTVHPLSASIGTVRLLGPSGQ
jgi:eukaryotic-like serine/threonine-protein kinase